MLQESVNKFQEAMAFAATVLVLCLTQLLSMNMASVSVDNVRCGSI